MPMPPGWEAARIDFRVPPAVALFSCLVFRYDVHACRPSPIVVDAYGMYGLGVCCGANMFHAEEDMRRQDGPPRP